jgi:hypothetical protein
MQADIVSVLLEFGIKHEKTVEWLRVKCPYHDDTVASAGIHHKSHIFHCFVCNKNASLKNYLMKYSNLSLYQINQKFNIKSDCKNPVLPSEVERFHQAIWEHPTFLHELHHRMITDEIIRFRRLGVHDSGVQKRVVIPILNDIGEYANLRLYLPGAKEFKFLNLAQKDKQKIRFTPIEQLEYDQILVCGGELKAYAAAAILNKFDIGAVAPTCGENMWPIEQNWRFENKLLWINCDIDETGKRFAEIRCRLLKPVAREIHKVTFTPEEVGLLEKGDLNDFLRLGGDIYKKLLDTPEWVMIPAGELLDDTPLPVFFRDAFDPKNVGKRTETSAIVAAVNNETFLAAKTVEVTCPRGKDICMHCDVNSAAMLDKAANGMIGTLMKIAPENPAVLALIGERTAEHVKTFRECFRIPHGCKVCSFAAKETFSVTEVRLEEEIEATSRAEPLTQRVGYVIDGDPVIEPDTYKLIGRLHPSPKTQAASYLISSMEKTRDALDSYTPPSSAELAIFKPREWAVSSIGEKLDQIYADFEANVTRIYQRRDVHIGVDLVYHSVLHFDFGDVQHCNGWLELLLIGDTSEGKSEITKCIQKHYSLGVTVDCKNATAAGLLIGIDSHGKKNFSVYGVYPKNDRMLVILEELKEMAETVFIKFTEVRSSGEIKMAKIENRKKKARVRCIGISNPADGRQIDSYTYGVDAALGIIGRYEDLRRFDFVIVVGKDDIDRTVLNESRLTPPVVQHEYTDTLCEQLVLKAWKCTEIEFESTAHILNVTAILCEKYGHGPPILNTNAAHLKIAKLSAALAARTCSYATGDKEEKLVVRNCHVDYIVKYLERIYSAPSMKLDGKASSVKAATQLRDVKSLEDFIRGMMNSKNIVVRLASEDIISSVFVRDLCGDFHTGASFFAKMIQCNALQKIKGDRYSKTTEFIKFINGLNLDTPIPDYLKEKF